MPPVSNRVMMTTKNHSHHSRRSICFMRELAVLRMKPVMNNDTCWAAGICVRMANFQTQVFPSWQLSNTRVIAVRCLS